MTTTRVSACHGTAVCKNACMSTQVEVGAVLEPTRGDRMRMALRHADVGVQEMADYLDVSRTSVSNWINDRRKPSRQTTRLWALRCGVDVTWLDTGRAPTMPSGPDEAGTPPGTRTLNPLIKSQRELPSNVRELRPARPLVVAA